MEQNGEKVDPYFKDSSKKYRVKCSECGYEYTTEEYIENSKKEVQKCKNCGAKISSVDVFMCHFCDDAIEVLQDYDLKIRKKMLDGNNKKFYIYDVKGIGVRSITEPIIKFLIYTNLSDKYRMLSERTFYGNKKLLDLAIFYKPISDKEIADTNVEWEPDIAIEMKWAGMKKDGNLYNGWLKQIKLDIEKINKLQNIDNKYFMLFTIVQGDKEIFNPLELRESISNSIDKRKFRNREIKFIHSNYFKTMGFEDSEIWRFYLQLWKIV